ncbi:translation initiation factor IF-2 associated domain-containing protein [endosymbiont of Lamellibrachia barhami]|uniref:translation initiation factor IF-2 associated domain-containing protein n=1 Tax=endosymbiont of Lamellibrachia barhami TaxID=205975 RepID=UPI0015AF4929|nr:translation initiation factor IF-2 associated domain-containing protein [endosymbiont of Lamellibrachia barhami]
MSEVTVEQLAKVVGIPSEQLLGQLADAGIQAKGPDDKISDDEKSKLLNHLRQIHGKKATISASAPNKVTLRRKTVSELRQPGATRRNPLNRATSTPSKTVSVEVRKKRTYVKRSVVAGDDVTQREAAAARLALEEQSMQQAVVEAEVEARKAAEAKKREEEQAEVRQAEEETRLKAEEEARRQAEEASEVARQAELVRVKKEQETKQQEAARGKKGNKESKGKEQKDSKGGSSATVAKVHVSKEVVGAAEKPSRRRERRS